MRVVSSEIIVVDDSDETGSGELTFTLIANPGESTARSADVRSRNITLEAFDVGRPSGSGRRWIRFTLRSMRPRSGDVTLAFEVRGTIGVIPPPPDAGD